MKREILISLLVVNVYQVFSGPVLITKHIEAAPTLETSPRFILSEDTRPISYELWINTNSDLTQLQYTGKVKIIWRALVPTETISLNSKSLQIGIVKVDDVVIASEQIKLDIENEMLHITMSATVNPDETDHVLEIDFTGLLRTDLSGFYRSSYENDAQETV